MQILSTRPSLKSSRRSSRFTLIELLVVMGIVIILMAIAGPAFDKMAIGTGVDAGVRAVTGQLRMARQYAIANRKYVAVLIPAQESDPADAQYMGVRSVRADDAAGPYTAVPDTSWEFLPVGGIIYEVHQNGSLRTPGDPLAIPPSDNCAMTVNWDIDDDGTNETVRAIIFTPTGALSTGSEHFITIAQGVVSNPAGDNSNAANSRVTITNNTNWRELSINAFTGRVKVE